MKISEEIILSIDKHNAVPIIGALLVGYDVYRALSGEPDALKAAVEKSNVAGEALLDLGFGLYFTTEVSRLSGKIKRVYG